MSCNFMSGIFSQPKRARDMVICVMQSANSCSLSVLCSLSIESHPGASILWVTKRDASFKFNGGGVKIRDQPYKILPTYQNDVTCKAEMHKIRFRLKFRSRLAGRAYIDRSPNLLLDLREGSGGERKGWKRIGGKRCIDGI